MKNKTAGMDATLAGMLQAKSDFRRRQAKLPFVRKIEIVVRLQKLAAEIGKITGRKPAGMTWQWPTRKHQNDKMIKTQTRKCS